VVNADRTIVTATAKSSYPSSSVKLGPSDVSFDVDVAFIVTVIYGKLM